MKNTQKLLSLLLTLCMILALAATPVSASTFIDAHGNEIELDDTLEAYTAAKLVGATVDNPNEIRRFTGQDPIPEPWADEYQRTKNNESAAGGESNA